MMDNERRKLIKLAAERLYVHSVQCGYCNNTFDDMVETADTDMVSCYCSSVYSLSSKQLLIAPLMLLRQRWQRRCGICDYQQFCYRRNNRGIAKGCTALYILCSCNLRNRDSFKWYKAGNGE